MLAMFIGAIPAALLRWVILRRTLPFWPAAGISFLILVVLLAVYEAMGLKSISGTSGAAALSFTFLYRFSARNGEELHAKVTASEFRSGVDSLASSQPAEPVAGAVPRQEPRASTENERRLIELKALMNKGLITQSEYQLKRSEILNQL